MEGPWFAEYPGTLSGPTPTTDVQSYPFDSESPPYPGRWDTLTVLSLPRPNPGSYRPGFQGTKVRDWYSERSTSNDPSTHPNNVSGGPKSGVDPSLEGRLYQGGKPHLPGVLVPSHPPRNP